MVVFALVGFSYAPRNRGRAAFSHGVPYLVDPQKGAGASEESCIDSHCISRIAFALSEGFVKQPAQDQVVGSISGSLAQLRGAGVNEDNRMVVGSLCPPSTSPGMTENRARQFWELRRHLRKNKAGQWGSEPIDMKVGMC